MIATTSSLAFFRHSKSVFRIVQGLFVLLVCWYALSKIDWHVLRGIQIRWPWLFAGILTNAVYLFLYTFLWQFITKSYKTAIPWKKAANLWLFSLIGKYVPLIIGTPMIRIAGYKRYSSCEIGPLVLCSYLEWFVSLYAGAILALFFAVLLNVSVPIPYFRWICGGLLIAGAVFYWMHLFEQFFLFLMRKFNTGTSQSLVRFNKSLLLFGYCASWMIIGLSFYFIVKSVVDIDISKYWMCCFIYIISGISSIIAIFAPAGLGIREGVIFFFLRILIGGPPALLGSILARLVSLTVELVAAVGAWILGHNKFDIIEPPKNLTNRIP